MLLIGSASASDWTSIDNYKDYDDITKTVTITDRALLTSDKTVAEYTLLDNTDMCLIDCSATGTAKLYYNGHLFTDIEFRTKENKLGNLKWNQFYIEVTDTWEEEVTDYNEVCVEENTNGTKYDSCSEVEIGKHKESRNNTYWKEYNYESLDAGDYKWKLEGRKNDGDTVDWIATTGYSFEKLTDWAWWSGSWTKKKHITDVHSYYSIINVSYEASMNVDFSDLRFTDSVELNELSYYIEMKVDSNYAIVRIKTEAEIDIYMYYGNGVATTTSNVSAVYGLPSAVYFFDNNPNDSVGTHNGTESGGITYNSSGKFYGAINMDGTDNRIIIDSVASIFSTTNQWSIVSWIRSGGGAGGTIFGTTTDATWGAGDSVASQRLRAPNINTYIATNPTEYYIDGSAMNLVTWEFLVSTRNASRTAIFSNATLKGSRVMTQNLGALTLANIGFAADNAYFLGQISEFMIYPRALSNTEIKNLYNTTKDGVVFGAEEMLAVLITTTTQLAPVDGYNTAIPLNDFSANITMQYGNALL